MNNLLSIFPMFTSRDSLFQKMVSLGAPWTSEIAQSMDISFFTMYSGIKLPTHYVKLNISDSGVVNSQLIAETLWNIYGKNWEHLWDAYIAKYNPIDSYNLTETISRDKTDDRTIGRKGTLSSTVDSTTNQTVDESGTISVEYGHVVDTSDERFTQNKSDGTSALQHGQIVTNQNTINQYRYGFNSTEQVPTDTQTEMGSQNHTGTDTTTNHSESTVSDNDTVKQTNSGTDKATSQSDTTRNSTTKDTREDSTTDDTTDNDILSENITRARTGNIGSATYQQLLEQQFELWKWNFYWQVFEDCDKFLCLSVFDECQLS